MKKYKAAVIGCGRIGAEEDRYSKKVRPATHAGAYAKCRRTDLVALVESDPERMAKAQKLYPKAEFYCDIGRMLKAIRPDIVSVATPTLLHREHVTEIIRSGVKPVIFCEKPVAHSLDEAESIVALCQRNGTSLFINHQRHFDPILNAWAERVRTGYIGKVLQGHVCYYNGLYNNGTHWVDLLRMFLGDPLWVIGCYNQATTGGSEKENIDGLIGFRSGAVASLQSLSKDYGHSECLIMGETGMVAIRKLGFEIEYRKKITNSDFKGVYQLTDASKREGKMRSMLVSAVEHMAAFLDGAVKPISTGEDGLADLKILHELQRSAEAESKKIFLEN